MTWEGKAVAEEAGPQVQEKVAQTVLSLSENMMVFAVDGANLATLRTVAIGPVLFGTICATQKIYAAQQQSREHGTLKVVPGRLEYAHFYREFKFFLTTAEDLDECLAEHFSQQQQSNEEFIRAHGQQQGEEEKERAKKRKHTATLPSLPALPSFGVVTSARDWIMTRCERTEDGSWETAKSKSYPLTLKQGEPLIAEEVSAITRALLSVYIQQMQAVDAWLLAAAASQEEGQEQEEQEV